MKRIGRLVLIILGLCVCGVIGVFAVWMIDFVIVTSSAPQLAHALVPPEYPNSELIKTYQRMGTESIGDWRTYRTADSIAKVLAFMEEHMPGFTTEDNSSLGIVYRNLKEDKSDLAQRAADIACSSRFCIEFNAKEYPSAYVTLYSDPQNPTGTLIDVNIDWPAP